MPLRRVPHQIKPSRTRFPTTDGPEGLSVPVSMYRLGASSEYWEIIPTIDPAIDAPHVEGEQPRPPFTNYQGEAWSYIPDVAAMSAYSLDATGTVLDMDLRDVVVTESGRMLVYGASQA